MSEQGANPETAAIIAEALESAIANYCGIAGIVFLLYEYTITFGREVDLFWTRRFSGATVLFLANKYITLLNHLFDLSLYIPFHVSDKIMQTCNLHAKAFSSIDYLQYVPWAAFSGIRAFALCKSWALSVLVFTLSLVPLGVNFSVKMYGVNDPTAGCEMGEIIDHTTAIKLVLVARMSLIAADVLLITITWRHLPRNKHKLHTRGCTVGRRVSAERTITQDARNADNVSAEHRVLLIMNTLHIVFTFTSTSEITYFTEPVSAVLVSRFLLDLQEASLRSAVHLLGTEGPSYLDSESGDVSTRQSVVFARVAGSIASSIPPEINLHHAESGWSTGTEAG
ncbi:hypothetical protein OH76DRAFT_1417317 [Lentinus brumalis]|uniref:DUF6533 domain-containing protein n=1 Tax=Lentinus brumalis TaxID=2498619 RepID=A0A371DFE1_9APHY|nr:hypothetical protein OH76DRAFT_1417317 [Polyporus brumalis]